MKRYIYRGVILVLCAVLALAAFDGIAYAEPTQSPSASADASASPEATPAETPTPTIALTKTPEPVNPYEDLILKDGDSGDDVISLQMRLRDLGYYNYKITGDFGSVTAQAVRDFQEDNKLKQDGVVGVGNRGYMVKYTAWDDGAWTVTNNRTVELPVTGGTGTHLHYAFGLLLVTAAAIMYLCNNGRKRQKGGW